jgi:hypothetical protein
MNTSDPAQTTLHQVADPHNVTPPAGSTDPTLWMIALVGLVSWLSISLGFLGLKMLMQQRPQFAGEPMRFSKSALVQEAPQIVVRRVTDDIAAIKPMQPEWTEIQCQLRGRRDYRGLRTIIDMSGEFRARYGLSNELDEAVFVLFKCRHPRTEEDSTQLLVAGGLTLRSSISGLQETAKDAWFWSGTLAAHEAVEMDVSYQVASLKGVTFRVGDSEGYPVKQWGIQVQRDDLPAMQFENSQGILPVQEGPIRWERKDFLGPDFFTARIVESRSLYTALAQLLEIGPVVSLLFLISVGAVITARRRLTVAQVLTISATFAFYFPLVLYLSSRFAFALALMIAVVVPGALLLNYARWLLGVRLGLGGGAVFLGLFQVFPTLAAFAGWNRGMVLLCLGVVTLWVLINLQNQTLRRQAMAGVGLSLIFLPAIGQAGEFQVTLPGEMARVFLEERRDRTLPLVSFAPAEYRIRHEPSYFQVEVRVELEVLQGGPEPQHLFSQPIYLQTNALEQLKGETVRLVTLTNRLALFATNSAQAVLRLAYRVPIETQEAKQRARVPLLIGPAAHIQLLSGRPDLEFSQGGLWAKTLTDRETQYELGSASDTMLVEWRDQPGEPGRDLEAGKPFYGIGIGHTQNLTVINSDGSCTHFAEIELPVYQAAEFVMGLPGQTRLISVSVNGIELSSPLVENQRCRITLPPRQAQQTSHRLSFRLAYPAVRLGFVGSIDLTLPELFQTTGVLEWIVTLPSGLESQVVSSGLENQSTAPDLSRFGDYGRILKSHPQIYLAKDLAPPGAITLNLKYRQKIAGVHGSPQAPR